MTRRLLASVLLALAMSSQPWALPSARAAYSTIEGGGSSSAELLVQQWIADVDANGLRVVYTGGGSTRGRKDFAEASVDFAISEIPYQGTDETGQSDTSNGRAFGYLPITAGGTAFTYHLEVDGQLVRNLRLSGRTLARIFTGAITNWNDPEITADNNGRTLPDKQIIPVVRSDGAGITAQLTSWMDARYPGIWRPYYGRDGHTSYYPRSAGNIIGQSGSDGVMNTVAGLAGDGMIGYVEYPYAATRDYPVVKVLNRAGYYVAPTPYNVAVALTGAEIDRSNPNDPSTYLTQILDGVYNNADPRAYPVSSYSYLILPTGADDPRMTTSKRQTLADFLFYALCSGQTKAAPYGYSPLPRNLVEAGFEQIARLKQADPAVELENRDISSCNNPTFDSKDPDRNLLAENAPQPAACDARKAGPCGYQRPPSFDGVRLSGRPTVGGSVTTRLVGSGRYDARYQWRLDGRAIRGATRPHLDIPPSFLGRRLSVRVVALGTSRLAPARRVEPGRARLLRPRILGASRVGQVEMLTGRVRLGGITKRLVPSRQVHLQWYADRRRIPGAITPYWVPTRAQRGAVLSVQVRVTADGYRSLLRRITASARVR